jgi:type IV pilus assembly protein PilN
LIKINLADKKANFVPLKKKDGSSDSVDDFIQVGENELKKQLIQKIIILLLPSVALFAWENISVPQKQQALTGKQKQISEITKKIADTKVKTAKFPEAEKNFKNVSIKIELLEKLRKSRKLEVKVLDNLQRVIPEKVWISRLEISDGHLSISGSSLTDIALTSFMDSLAKSVFLKDVSLVRASEAGDDFTGLTVKKFEVSTGIEVGL